MLIFTKTHTHEEVTRKAPTIMVVPSLKGPEAMSTEVMGLDPKNLVTFHNMGKYSRRGHTAGGNFPYDNHTCLPNKKQVFFRTMDCNIITQRLCFLTLTTTIDKITS